MTGFHAVIKSEKSLLSCENNGIYKLLYHTEINQATRFFKKSDDPIISKTPQIYWNMLKKLNPVTRLFR